MYGMSSERLGFEIGGTRVISCSELRVAIGFQMRGGRNSWVSLCFCERASFKNMKSYG